ncbi:MAG: hypothetical protein NTX88_03605 [Candidatus Atribacteria bacterium]|nr:hypothetical protein [Candidatus Atribacteria bacterium]
MLLKFSRNVWWNFFLLLGVQVNRKIRYDGEKDRENIIEGGEYGFFKALVFPFDIRHLGVHRWDGQTRSFHSTFCPAMDGLASDLLGYPLKKHLEESIQGTVHMSTTLEDALLVSQRGG